MDSNNCWYLPVLVEWAWYRGSSWFVSKQTTISFANSHVAGPTTDTRDVAYNRTVWCCTKYPM
jgi:hypothetical protein